MSSEIEEATKTPSIFVYSLPCPWIGPEDVLSYAMAEDGTVVAQHCSSSRGWARRDMGLLIGCEWQHDHYNAHYPNGYKLVDLTSCETGEELDSHEGFAAAFALNQAQRKTEPANV